VVSAEQQYAEVTTGALTAIERSAELWKQGATRLTEQVEVVSKLPMPDFAEAMNRYFEYLQQGIEINRDFAKRWTGAMTTFSDVLQAQTTSVGDPIRGHREAITEWITGEADTVQKSAKAQVDAISAAKRDQAEARYDGLSKAELSELLAQRDLPRNGTNDELVARLVEADTQ